MNAYASEYTFLHNFNRAPTQLLVAWTGALQNVAEREGIRTLEWFYPLQPVHWLLP
jgi:hypothetical protein